MTREEITAEFVRSVLRYDPSTGEFSFIKSRGFRKAGQKTGYNDANGYIIIGLARKQHKAHRLAYLYMKGEWPEHEIDHIDGDGTNNRWINLRSATRQQNVQNTRLSKTNTSGYRGVTFNRRVGKWAASIRFNKVGHHLGYFDDPKIASLAYQKAEIEVKGEFRRISNREATNGKAS